MGKKLTTGQAAEKAGITRDTIHRWIRDGLITAPEYRVIEGRATRLWTAGDVERLRKLKAQHKPGPKPKRRK
jgi:excisionase family DNA binding protein